ncbi:MAG: c-type cytochrome domain-containing protein [Hyphomicrobiales bacterium]
MSQKERVRAGLAVSLAALLALAAVPPAFAAEDAAGGNAPAAVAPAEDTAAPAEAVPVPEEKVPASVTHQMYLDMKLGKLDIHGNNAVVDALVLQRDIPIRYDYIATLMRTPNAFGEGPACVVCHGSNEADKSYRGLDLSSCEGILRGATEEPQRPVIVSGQPDKSLIVKMLRNNRMPLGVSFFEPVQSDSIDKVRNWIETGAKDDENFQTNVLPLFADPAAFSGGIQCTECHKSFRDPPSFNEVNLTSHESIMTGAFSKTRKKEGLPGIPIVVPFDAENSPLFQRLTMNRMPPGVDPGVPVHANTLLLARWIEQGAWCK